MVGVEVLQKHLDAMPRVKYADLRYIETKCSEAALRADSFELNESRDERIACRVFDTGYGISSSNQVDSTNIQKTVATAISQAKTMTVKSDLASVKPEEGRVEHAPKKKFEVEEAREFLIKLGRELEAKLKAYFSRCELILSHSEVESTLVTSEGTKITEKAPSTDLIIYLVARDLTTGFASKIIGGKGGMEIIYNKEWDAIADDLVSRAEDSLKAQTLSPLQRGERFKLILDSDVAGALAHEIAHMMEADLHQRRLFANLKVPSDLKIVDNPLVPGGYGSFTWDDEGVRGRRKVLIGRERVELLHTRLTAGKGEVPGNAHGVTHLPKPTMSNVYVQPSDWHIEEILQETRFGIYARGLVRAESNTADGAIELIPGIAYLIDQKEIKTPIKKLKIVDNVRNVIQRIDAIGEYASLRPNIEKGFCIAEGGPCIRLNGVLCA